MLSDSYAPSSPPINASTAGALTVLFTFLYIAPFYLSRSLRISSRVSRNSPSTIKARARSVLGVCIVCVVITIAILTIHGSVGVSDCLQLLGIFPISFVDIAKCFLLIVILFSGPLFEEGVVDGNWRYWYSWRNFKEAVFDDWIGWRNLVVGPVSEEVVFRSLSVSLFLLAQANPKDIVFYTPVIFGLAHLHHLNEFIIKHQRPGQTYLSTALTPSILLSGIVQVLFQFTYTSLFGFFATFLYLRTGNLFSCILAHSFCNWMGLPRVWGRVGKIASHEVGSAVNGTDDGQDPISGLQQPMEDGDGIVWTLAYYVLLFGGAYGFYRLLWPLTESNNALAEFR